MPVVSRREALLLSVFTLVVGFFVTTYRVAVVRGQSMEPTYHDGQFVLVRRRSWWAGPLRRNDVVLLRMDRDVIIKRIALLPGDALSASTYSVLESTQGTELADYYDQNPGQSSKGTDMRLVVPPGFVVVLGDNRHNSEDSRAFGPVPERDVLGVVVGAPPSPVGAGSPVHG